MRIFLIYVTKVNFQFYENHLQNKKTIQYVSELLFSFLIEMWAITSQMRAILPQIRAITSQK